MLLSWTSEIYYVLLRILETVHTAFMLRQIYYYTIISFGDYEGIAKIDWWVFLSKLTSANSSIHQRTWLLVHRSIGVSTISSRRRICLIFFVLAGFIRRGKSSVYYYDRRRSITHSPISRTALWLSCKGEFPWQFQVYIISSYHPKVLYPQNLDSYVFIYDSKGRILTFHIKWAEIWYCSWSAW